MPAQYEDARDSLVAHGKSYNDAQAEAAAIYNKRHPSAPMSPAHPEGLKKKLRERVMQRLGGK